MGFTYWAAISCSDPGKTAVLLVGPSGQLDLYSQHPIVLSGVSVPGTLLKKWVGVLWDCELTFIPFLEDMIKVARAAFRPLCALARDGLIWDGLRGVQKTFEHDDVELRAASLELAQRADSA